MQLEDDRCIGLPINRHDNQLLELLAICKNPSR